LGWLTVAGGLENLRQFPPNTVFATLQAVRYPQIKLQELPSNWGSSLLGLMLLSTQKVSMSPASVIRDQNNNNHVQNYIDNLIDEPVAVQFDYQGRVWTIWQLTDSEIKWVIRTKRNIWSSQNSNN
jgi:hypothetical protein